MTRTRQKNLELELLWVSWLPGQVLVRKLVLELLLVSSEPGQALVRWLVLELLLVLELR